MDRSGSDGSAGDVGKALNRGARAFWPFLTRDPFLKPRDEALLSLRELRAEAIQVETSVAPESAGVRG